jgi:hypothetical protein
MSERWCPLMTSPQMRPEPGSLIGHKHAVWRVVRIEDTPLTDVDEEAWMRAGCPDVGTWAARPYRIAFEWVDGVEPKGASGGDGRIRRYGFDVPAGRYKSWQVYHTGRWPRCSCCGEPMPCRAELEDRQVSAGLDRVAKLEAIPPGCCWGCTEPITTRQNSLTYPGENLDLPGGQQPRFHTRARCRQAARRYEAKWLAADPRRERILTWPHCDGILIVHSDRSSECVGDRSQPDCEGHLTHDHSMVQACYVGDPNCPRGCDPHNHPGTATTPRPDRRSPEQGVIA